MKSSLAISISSSTSKTYCVSVSLTDLIVLLPGDTTRPPLTALNFDIIISKTVNTWRTVKLSHSIYHAPFFSYILKPSPNKPDTNFSLDMNSFTIKAIYLRYPFSVISPVGSPSLSLPVFSPFLKVHRPSIISLLSLFMKFLMSS